jgi:hypothetical protein
MYYFEIDGEEYPHFLSNRVWKKLQDKIGRDPMKLGEDESEDKSNLSWMEDPDVQNFIGYESLIEGCGLEGIKVPLTKDKYILNLQRGLEISGMILQESATAANYVMKHFIKSNDLPEDVKKK